MKYNNKKNKKITTTGISSSSNNNNNNNNNSNDNKQNDNNIIEYPINADYLFARTFKDISKKIDEHVERTENNLLVMIGDSDNININIMNNTNNDDDRVERLFEILVAKNDERCDKIDEHIMHMRGDVAANDIEQQNNNNKKKNNKQEKISQQSHNNNNYTNTYNNNHNSSFVRPQDSFKDVVDNRVETDLNFELPRPFGGNNKNNNRRDNNIERTKSSSSASSLSKHPLVSMLVENFKYNNNNNNNKITEEGESGIVCSSCWEVKVSDPILPTNIGEDNPATFVDTEKGLDELERALSSASIFAVDLEHHSYRTYRGFTCVIQISTREQDFVVDALKLRHLIGPALGRHFENEEKLKVFHGANSDMIWLQRDFGIYVVNMFDTGQAARVLELPSFGLAYLLKHYCGIKAEKKYQLADWRLRPLSGEMINYARNDTHSLLYVYDRLKQELFAKGGVECIQSVFFKSRDVCLLTYEPFIINDLTYYDDLVKSGNASSGGGGGGGGEQQQQQQSKNGTPSVISRSAQQAQLSKDVLKSQVALASFEGLFKWRDECARVNDESLGFVMSRYLMLRLATEQPKTSREVLSSTRGESTFVVKFSQVIADVIKTAVERGHPINAAPTAGELYRREHEQSLLLLQASAISSVKEDEKKQQQQQQQQKSQETPAVNVSNSSKTTTATTTTKKRMLGGGMMKMMTSTPDEDDDEEEEKDDLKKAKEAAERVKGELAKKHRQTVFPSMAQAAETKNDELYTSGNKEEEEEERRRGSKRKSKEPLLKSFALKNKDKSERIHIGSGISLPAPLRKKTTEKLGFGLTHDGELNDYKIDDDDDDDHQELSVKDQALRARAILRKRQKKAMMSSRGGGGLGSFTIDDSDDEDSDAEEEERILLAKEKEADLKILTKGEKTLEEIVEQTQKTLGMKFVHEEILKGPQIMQNRLEKKRMDAIRGKKGFNGGEWIDPFDSKKTLKSKAFPRSGNKMQSFK